MFVARALLVVIGGLVVAPAFAAVVVDPVADIQPGITVGIQSFVTIPASDPNAATKARIQYVTPAYDGSGRLFVNDQRGQLWVTNAAGAAPTSYFNLATAGVGLSVPSGEAGFIGIAFHPNFNGDSTKAGYSQFYTHYTATVASGTAAFLDSNANSHDNVVREWSVADPAALVATITGSRELIRVGHFASNHNGGTIAFNPTAAEGAADYGKLYIALGDGGGANDPRDYAQNLSVPLGKILRIDPNDPDGAGPLAYTVPDDNPYVGTGGALAEIYASGLRNPQQFSWDAATGAFYISDIGQAQIEEVNLGRAGADYGWVEREGAFAKSPDKANTQVFDDPNTGGFDDPIAQYDHDDGDAIGGGFLYRGSLIPELVGKFVLTDITTGRLFYFDPAAAAPGSPATMLELLLTLNGQPFTFLAAEGYGGGPRVDLRLGADEDGELYLLTKRDGDIYRFVASAQAPVPEPASWAMMIAGFGAVGGAMRSRRTLVRA